MSNICKRFIVSGRVQGVFYRDSAMKKAREFNITGWIKNLESGEVELLACGDSNRLNRLEEWLWKGPPAASVEDVKIEELDWQDFSDFRVITF